MNTNSYYRFVETSCTIGKHANCEVQVEDENVEVEHCKIIYRHPHFYLKNISKANGIYQKVLVKLAIRNNMVAEMGSHLFCFQLADTNKMKIKIISGDYSGETFNFDTGKRKIIIGRKSTNDINIGTDNHLSNIHSRIVYQ